MEPIGTPWTFDPPLEHVGRSAIVYDRIDSTNQRALHWRHDPSRDGMVLIAQEQTAGRGQHGRVWQAPPRSSVLLSALLFPPAELRRPALLTSMAAVAVTELIREVSGLAARIKWPNDVLLRGKKVCGILIEQRGVGNPGAPIASVVGIGLNIAQSEEDFREADLPLAGSLASVAGLGLDWTDVAERLVRHLDVEYGRLKLGDFQPLETRWKEALDLIGRTVEVEFADRRLRGRLLDVGFDEAILQSEDDAMHSFPPETVRHVVALGAANT